MNGYTGRKTLTSLRQISEINLTPLMDLTFILLITFIITFPLIEQGIPINLPRAAASSLDPDRARTVSVDGKGNVFLDDSPIDLEELKSVMKSAAKTDPGAVVMVRADESIRYATLVDVLQALHEARVTRLALVTQAEGERR